VRLFQSCLRRGATRRPDFPPLKWRATITVLRTLPTLTYFTTGDLASRLFFVGVDFSVVFGVEGAVLRVELFGSW